MVDSPDSGVQIAYGEPIHPTVERPRQPILDGELGPIIRDQGA